MAEVYSGKIRFSVIVEIDGVESSVGEFDEDETRERITGQLREAILKGLAGTPYARNMPSVSVRARHG